MGARTIGAVPRDTTTQSQERQDALFRAMAPEQRVAMAVEMSETIRQVARDGIRMRHPSYTDEEVRLTSIRLVLGDDLFVAAFPGAPRLDG